MSYEKGNLGLISTSHSRIPVDEWSVRTSMDECIVYCSSHQAVSNFDLKGDDVNDLIGRKFQVRLDNELSIFYGIAKCHSISRPYIVRRSDIPLIENSHKSLCLYCHFSHQRYGPYTLRNAIGMARNGNPMFFDLLPVQEVDQKVAEGDVRFLC